MTNFKMF